MLHNTILLISPSYSYSHFFCLMSTNANAVSSLSSSSLCNCQNCVKLSNVILECLQTTSSEQDINVTTVKTILRKIVVIKSVICY